MLILRIAEAMEKHKVDYAVVGGFAVALHGAVRGTVDLDLILKFNKSGFLAAEKALQSLGFESRLPVTAGQVFDFREDYINNRNLIAWSFYNPSRPSELVDIVLTHDLAKLKTKLFTVHSHAVRVLNLEGLVQMKKQSGRPQDLEDVRALESLMKEAKKK